MNYLLKKIKQNVYSLKIFNKDNLIIYKILKISINVEEYLNEYNIYKKLLVENKNYNIENISNYLKFENINIIFLKKVTDTDDTDYHIHVIDLLCDLYDDIINLYILYGNYDPNNKTLNNYLLQDDLNIILILINNALINRRNASNIQNLKHCDFKTNNILVDNNMNVYLFDFDFSIILKANETITISENDKINLYLNVKKGHKIYGMFLDLFDIYLLALSIIFCYNNKNIKKLIKLQNYFEISLLSNKELCNDFYVFYIIYSNLLLKLPKKIYYNIYLSYTTYNMIYDILQNPIIEFSSSTNKLFTNEQYLNAIQFIKKAVNI